MKCERCGKNEANIHFQGIFNGNALEYNICEECARKESNLNPNEFLKELSLGSLLSNIMDSKVGEKDLVDKKTLKSCPECKMSYGDFRKSGKIGCDNCYDVFRDEFRSVLKKVNGSSRHVGKKPKIIKEVSEHEMAILDLKRELKSAVEKEEYESAAKLRDQIRQLEK